MYAFAVMLNEMLLEELPFADAALATVMHNVVTYRRRPTAYTADVSDPVGCQLMSLIHMGWNQDPQLRVSFSHLARELGALLHLTAETFKHGTAAAAASPAVTTPPRPPAADVNSSITTLSQWFESTCRLGSSDSLPLAHALVTVKCISSAAALDQALQRTPDLLARELKVSSVHEQQIKAALGNLKSRLRLENLNEEQVGQLLDHCMMSSSKNLFQEQELTGTFKYCHLYYIVLLDIVTFISFSSRACPQQQRRQLE